MANLNSLSTTTNQLQQQLGGSRLQKTEKTEQAASNALAGGNDLPPANEKVSVSQPDTKQIEKAVAKLSDFAQSLQRDLSFSIDGGTGQTVIIVKDRGSDEVVRQIPSEDLLQLAQNLRELQEKLESSKGNLLEVRV